MYSYENLQTWIYRHDSTADDLAATGDGAEMFNVVTPITVYAVGTLITTATVGTAGVLKFDRRITTGSDTGRGDGDVGTCAIAALAAGKVVINRVTPIDLNPGDQVVPEVTTAVGTSGAGRHFLLYRQREEIAANLGDVVVVTT